MMKKKAAIAIAIFLIGFASLIAITSIPHNNPLPINTNC